MRKNIRRRNIRRRNIRRRNIRRVIWAVLSLLTILITVMVKSVVSRDSGIQKEQLRTVENDNIPEIAGVKTDGRKKGQRVNLLPREIIIGWKTMGGDRYRFDANGKRESGFREIDGNLYWFDPNGKMETGWKTINEKKYNFGEDGIAMTGWKKIGGEIYCFSNKGILLTDMNTMKENIQKIIGRYVGGGTVGVYFKDLNSEEELSVNEQPFYPCSIIKANVCAAVYHYADKGELNLDEYRPYLAQMIKVSDNTSYNIIMRKLGNGNGTAGCAMLNSYIKSLGIFNTKIYHGLKPGNEYFPGVSSNVSTPRDMGLLFEKIYDHEICSPSYSREMIDLLADCKDASALKRGLPPDITFAHKSGWADYLYLDGGIIYLPRQNYILVVFTDGIDSRAELFHDISEYVYNCEKRIVDN